MAHIKHKHLPIINQIFTLIWIPWNMSWNKMLNAKVLKHERNKTVISTFTSMSPILLTALMIGLPTNDGKMWAGKFDPA